jgi:phage tail sheath gpL-like
MNDIKRADAKVIKELAKEAEGLKANRAFAVACATLKAQWYGEFMDPKTDDEGMKRLRAQLMVLEALPRMLDSLIASQTMAQRGQLRA